MTDLISLLTRFDELCANMASALQHAEPRLYPMLALAVVVAWFALPRRKDEP
jgi:hypothetical protein